MCDEWRRLARRAYHDQFGFSARHNSMPDDFAFHIREKSLGASAAGQHLYIVCAEVVEERLPVIARHGDARPICEFHAAAANSKRAVFRKEIWPRTHIL